MKRRGLSLLELLAVVTILGTIAMMIVPRIGGGKKQTQETSCRVQTRVVEIQASLWRLQTGSWPATTLSDLGASVDHFPEGLPTCPLDGSAYQLDASTGLVVGHDH